MFNQNRIYRIFQLINYLKSRPTKSIRNLSQFLQTSSRTVYRYLDLLTDLGFVIEKDAHGKFWIPRGPGADGVTFTPQETDYLKKLVKSAGKQSKLADSVLQKFYQVGELHPVSDNLFEPALGILIEKISMAIIENKQLLIKDYLSANSQTISDRLVEPICFTDNYTALCAFEVSTQQNKYFKLERMGDAEMADGKMTYEILHEFKKPDVFGFQGTSVNKVVELELNMRAYLVLREEYPMSRPLLKAVPEKSMYYFYSQVQSYLAPARFVSGLQDDIIVLGSKDFIQYVNRFQAS